MLPVFRGLNPAYLIGIAVLFAVSLSMAIMGMLAGPKSAFWRFDDELIQVGIVGALIVAPGLFRASFVLQHQRQSTTSDIRGAAFCASAGVMLLCVAGAITTWGLVLFFGNLLVLSFLAGFLVYALLVFLTWPKSSTGETEAICKFDGPQKTQCTELRRTSAVRDDGVLLAAWTLWPIVAVAVHSAWAINKRGSDLTNAVSLFWIIGFAWLVSDALLIRLLLRRGWVNGCRRTIGWGFCILSLQFVLSCLVLIAVSSLLFVGRPRMPE